MPHTVAAMVRFPRISTRYVFYDGGCGLCGKTVRVIRALDALDRTVYYDLTRDWETVSSRFPHLDRDACFQDMHVIRDGGGAYRGFDAYRSLAWALPLAWPFVPLLYLWPVRWAGWKIYRRVADRRHMGSCKLR